MCAGVQNVSRPMLMCHEMSQSAPSGMQHAPHTAMARCHGMAAERADVSGGAAAVRLAVAVDMSAGKCDWMLRMSRPRAFAECFEAQCCYARISRMTCPCTSVRRKSRPPKR